MTSILNYVGSSSSNSTTHLQPLSGNSLLSNKFPTTFIIQPPSSSQKKPNTLLTKRYKPSELGDLLMKKIKTQTANSSETFEDAIYDSPTSKPFEGLECHSMIEEERSPSAKSSTGQKSFEDILIPQRSLSTPSFFSSIFFSPSPMPTSDNQTQVQTALEALQKKMLAEQQAAALRSVILKAQLSQGPLSIPPLLSSSHSMSSKSQDAKNTLRSNEDDPEIIYGEVEFPLLSMINPQTSSLSLSNASVNLNKAKSSGKRQKKLAKISSNSSPTYESARQAGGILNDIRDSLTVTRADTQKSELEFGLSLREMTEDFAQGSEGKKRKSKKATSVKSSEGIEKTKKIHKKEKEQKSKVRSQKDSLFSPRNTSGRRLAERKLNRWQKVQADKQEPKLSEASEVPLEVTEKNCMVPVGPKYQVDVSNLAIKRQSSERRTPKMKWDPLSQDEGELRTFFEELRNLLNSNVDQEKAIQLLKENGNDVKKVLESIKANKGQYIESLTMQDSH